MSDKCRVTVELDGGGTQAIIIPASVKEGLQGGDAKSVKIRDVGGTIWLFNFAKVVSIKVEDIG